MNYGLAMKQRVLRFYDEGQITGEVAERLGVCKAYCRRVKQYRNQPPKKLGGGRPRKLDEQACEQIVAQVAAQPDITLAALQAWCKSRLNIAVSIGALFNTLRRLKLTLKKSH